MPNTYRVGVNTQQKTQLIVNPDGTTSQVSSGQYLRTLQKINPPASPLQRVPNPYTPPPKPAALPPKAINQGPKPQYYDKSQYPQPGSGFYEKYKNNPPLFKQPLTNTDPTISQPASRYRPTTRPTQSLPQTAPGPRYQPHISPYHIGGAQRIERQIQNQRMESADRILDQTAKDLGLTRQQFNDMPAPERNQRVRDLSERKWQRSPLNPRNWNPFQPRPHQPAPPSTQPAPDTPGYPLTPGTPDNGPYGPPAPGYPLTPGSPTNAPYGPPAPGSPTYPLTPGSPNNGPYGPPAPGSPNNSPHNPFGPAWQNFPWNDPGSPNSLNPPPQVPNHQFPPGPPGILDLPINMPPGTAPFNFRVHYSYRYKNYGRTFVDAFYNIPSYYLESSGGATAKEFFGIPRGLIIQELGQGNFEVKVRVDNGIGYIVVEHVGGATFFEDYSPTGYANVLTTKEIFIEKITQAAPDIPWPRTQNFPDAVPPDIQIYPPLPMPQMEPEGYPEYPHFPQSDPQPKPVPRPQPKPATPPKPSPNPNPNIPQPDPIPKPEPQNPPELKPAPFPFPFPMPGPNPTPNGVPAPMPGPYGPPAPVPKPPPRTQIRYEPTSPAPDSPNVPEQKWRLPEIIQQQISPPIPQQSPQPTPQDLKDEIRQVGDRIEDGARRGCQYKEDEMTECSIKTFKGNNLLTGAPEYETKTIQIHEKMTTFAQLQMQHIAEIRGEADGLRGKIKKLLDRLQIMRILNLMSTIASLHNAAMLSRNLAGTLGDATSTVITAVGRITGFMSAEESIDVNQLVGEAFNDLMKTTLGEDVWNGTKQSWLRANRILTAASSIVSSIRSIGDSARAIAEFTANNTGRIGNALKKFGVVGENAYPWMSTNVTARTAFQAKIDKFREGAENLDDAASALTSVAGETINIMDEATQIKEQWNTLDNAVKNAEEKPQAENKPKKDKEDKAKTDSKGKELDSVDIAISGEEP